MGWCAGTGGQLVRKIASLERKKTRGSKNKRNVIANGVNSARDSLKDTVWAIEAAVSAITRPLKPRVGN
jgi:hypothetical protein